MPRKKQTKIDEEAIARRAYEIWQARGADHGYHENDWYMAEHELRASSTPTNGNGKRQTKPRKSSAGKKPKASK